MTPTAIMLACVSLFLLIWNIVATSLYGNTASISYTLANLAETNPWILLLVGAIVGHAFWPVPRS